MVSGSIIMIGGVEWMHQGIHWVSSYGGTRTHDEMCRHNQVSLLMPRLTRHEVDFSPEAVTCYEGSTSKQAGQILA